MLLLHYLKVLLQLVEHLHFHENVDVQQVVKVLLDNAAKAKNMIKNLIDNFENHIDPNDPTNNCLDVAIITAPEKRTQKTKDKLKTIAGRVLNKWKLMVLNIKQFGLMKKNKL